VDELLSEKEQIDRMRMWWSDYGFYVIGGVVLGAAILFGFNYYESAQIAAQEEASAMYDALTENIADADLEAAEKSAADLEAAHGNSSYAAQSKLAMARLYMDRNRDVDAAETLRSMLAMDGFETIKHVGRVRLAKTLLYQDQAEEVLTLLDGQDNEAFAARYAEARGDAYAALGRFAEARSSYEAALQEPIPTIDQGLVQLKLLDLPPEADAIDATVGAAETEVSGEEPATPDEADEAGSE
jgi:predicted negative regulator of RcsB-dependent stress response